MDPYLKNLDRSSLPVSCQEMLATMDKVMKMHEELETETVEEDGETDEEDADTEGEKRVGCYLDDEEDTWVEVKKSVEVKIVDKDVEDGVEGEKREGCYLDDEEHTWIESKESERGQEGKPALTKTCGLATQVKRDLWP